MDALANEEVAEFDLKLLVVVGLLNVIAVNGPVLSVTAPFLEKATLGSALLGTVEFIGVAAELDWNAAVTI